MKTTSDKARQLNMRLNAAMLTAEMWEQRAHLAAQQGNRKAAAKYRRMTRDSYEIAQAASTELNRLGAPLDN